MASFQAKIGWERPRKRKIKILFPFPSDQTGNRKFQKKDNEIQKNQKIPLWLHFMPKQVGKGREKEKIKIVFPFPSDRIGNRKLQKNRRKFKKNSKKFNKLKKYHYGFISSQNRLGKAKKEKNKNFLYVPFRPDG